MPDFKVEEKILLPGHLKLDLWINSLGLLVVLLYLMKMPLMVNIKHKCLGCSLNINLNHKVLKQIYV